MLTTQLGQTILRRAGQDVEKKCLSLLRFGSQAEIVVTGLTLGQVKRERCAFLCSNNIYREMRSWGK